MRPEVESVPADAVSQGVESPPTDGHAQFLDSLNNGSHRHDAERPDVHVMASPTDSRGSRQYMVLFERATGVIGVVFLVAGLAIWRFRPGDHRLALVVLVCAMFLAILHYYSLEDTRNGEAESG